MHELTLYRKVGTDIVRWNFRLQARGPIYIAGIRKMVKKAFLAMWSSGSRTPTEHIYSNPAGCIDGTRGAGRPTDPHTLGLTVSTLASELSFVVTYQCHGSDMGHGAHTYTDCCPQLVLERH